MADRRVALVTGASRGIGAAVADALAADHDLILVARTAPSVAGAVNLSADLATTEGCAVLHAALGSDGRPISVLVNNAGAGPSAPLARTDDETWDHTLALNLTAPFFLCRALIPAMGAAGWGRVINIASTSAIKGYRYTAAYTASKAGLVGLTRALAVEFASKGVTVNAICPTFTNTSLVAAAVDNIVEKTGRDAATARASIESFMPQRRLLDPAEVGSLAAYLASDAARGINGQTLPIDGGETA